MYGKALFIVIDSDIVYYVHLIWNIGADSVVVKAAQSIIIKLKFVILKFKILLLVY